MSEVRAASFPRRDGDGRVTRLSDLVGVTLAGLVIGLLALVLLDGVFTLVGLGRFGRTSGWLVVILPVWLFVEEFRAWGQRAERNGARGQADARDLPPAPGPARVAAALVATAVGIAAGLLVAGAIAAVPPLWAGSLAGTVFACSYALIWFLGVRWLTRRMG